MNSKKILADFQIVSSKVSKFNYDSSHDNLSSGEVKISYDIDYNILEIREVKEKWFGREELCVDIAGKLDEKVIFTMQLTMQGSFIGNKERLDDEKFKERLELNGLATLSHLSRAYILSVSSLSGGIPPLKMPMFNIHSLMKLKATKSQNK